ncbi:alpha/beta fold hydrolase [Rheinheimera sp. WS51]|uniref:alpha/beta fold hydrolase n=1 Tax=Rheinheimera sp. WS51 TaxID=3425886 RepID=UPI003D8A6ABB
MLLHTHSTGSGEPIVLIHGLFGSYENLGIIARSLAEHYHVINIDVRNHGLSAHSEQMTYPLMAEDLKQTLDHLDLGKVAMLGHSMGGKLAMAFALAYPERVTKLILADVAPVAYPARHQQILAALNSVPLAEIKSRTDADKHLAQYINEAGVRQFLLKSLDKQEQNFNWRFNLTALTKQYDNIIGEPQQNGVFAGPCLFIKGGLSDYILAEHKEQILAHFPQAKIKVIEGTGHWLHAEKPVIFSRLVQDFLSV